LRDDAARWYEREPIADGIVGRERVNAADGVSDDRSDDGAGYRVSR
jgi:hypothetical protein